jgi:hypothetical protein
MESESSMTVKKKLFWVAAFVIFMAVAIVLCVELFTSTRETHYDGTLVRKGEELLVLAGIIFPYFMLEKVI